MGEYKHFDVEQRDHLTLLTLSDPRLSETLLISELHDELLEFVETRQPKDMVIDFGQVTFCSTAVINGILRTKKRLVARDGRLWLAAMRPPVREAFRLLNLDGTVFDIIDSADDVTE